MPNFQSYLCWIEAVCTFGYKISSWLWYNEYPLDKLFCHVHSPERVLYYVRVTSFSSNHIKYPCVFKIKENSISWTRLSKVLHGHGKLWNEG